MSFRLLQHEDHTGRRRVIRADEDTAAFVQDAVSVYALASSAITNVQSLRDACEGHALGEPVDLAVELAAGRIVFPIDHVDPAHLILSGTGLTHLGSAEGRDAMHRAAASADRPTDSMRMFLEGVEGGRPRPGEVGQQPEWFYKGDGSQLVRPEGVLELPPHAQDGGEEPELAGIYLIGPDGTPWRLGYCLANEYSDHVTERHNYLWLAHSKLRQAALGPELLVGELPQDVRGSSRVVRNGETLWERPFLSGEANMSHTLANLEHHHFKYDLFRRPGDVHVHFFGTATLSFADGIRTEAGDTFEIEAAPFRLPLRNRLEAAPSRQKTVRAL